MRIEMKEQSNKQRWDNEGVIRVLVVWVLVYVIILLAPGFNRSLLSLVSSVGSPLPFVRQSILKPSPPSAAALSLLASLASHLLTHLYTASFSLINTRLSGNCSLILYPYTTIPPRFLHSCSRFSSACILVPLVANTNDKS